MSSEHRSLHRRGVGRIGFPPFQTLNPARILAFPVGEAEGRRLPFPEFSPFFQLQDTTANRFTNLWKHDDNLRERRPSKTGVHGRRMSYEMWREHSLPLERGGAFSIKSWGGVHESCSWMRSSDSVERRDFLKPGSRLSGGQPKPNDQEILNNKNYRGQRGPWPRSLARPF